MCIFVPDLASHLRAGWVKKTSMEHAPCMSLTVGLVPSQSHVRDIKDVFWTLSSTISNFANLIQRKIPQRSVHAGCIISLCEGVDCIYIQFIICCISHYNTQWRGLAKLLISVGKANAKAWYGGISGESFSHVFFVSILYIIINRWSEGEGGRQKTYNYGCKNS